LNKNRCFGNTIPNPANLRFISSASKNGGWKHYGMNTSARAAGMALGAESRATSVVIEGF
jgi:hypothetical protein